MEFKGLLLFLILVVCCQAKETHPPAIIEDEARVTEVSVQGESGNYQFSVTLASPDLGCDQYADWWEVVDATGALRYRRILTHSHVNEQPFTRSGGPVDVDSEVEVWIRVHMNNTGYSQNAMFGSTQSGFDAREFPEDFAEGLDQQVPLPDGCRF